MKSNDIKYHVMLTHANQFASICEPLFKKSPINYFGLAKIFKDGSRSYLITDPTWGEVLLKNNYHLAGTEDALLGKPDNSHYPWFISNIFKVNQHTENLLKDCIEYNYGNGITLIEHGNDFVEFFHICANSGYEKVDDYLINNVDLLWNYLLYVKEALYQNNELKKAYEIRYNYQSILELKNKNTKKLSIQKYYLGGLFSDIYFTPRQIDCLILLFQNKSAKEQAKILGLSPRTIEEYLEILKRKTGCQSQIELVVKLSNNHTFRSIFRTFNDYQ